MPRIRLTIDTPSGVKKVLTIEHLPDGILRIYPRRDRNLEFEGRNLPIQDEHYSIYPHFDGDRPNVHVHHTFKLNDLAVRKVDLATLIAAPDGRLACPFVTVSVIDPRRPGFEFASKAGVEEIKLTSFDPGCATLIFTLAVIDKATATPDLTPFSIDQKRFYFEQLDLIAYFTFLNIPSQGASKNSRIATSMLRINDGEMVQLAGGNGTAVGPDHLIELVQETVKAVVFELAYDVVNRLGLQTMTPSAIKVGIGLIVLCIG